MVRREMEQSRKQDSPPGALSPWSSFHHKVGFALSNLALGNPRFSSYTTPSRRIGEAICSRCQPTVTPSTCGYSRESGEHAETRENRARRIAQAETFQGVAGLDTRFGRRLAGTLTKPPGAGARITPRAKSHPPPDLFKGTPVHARDQEKIYQPEIRKGVRA